MLLICISPKSKANFGDIIHPFHETDLQDLNAPLHSPTNRAPGCAVIWDHINIIEMFLIKLTFHWSYCLMRDTIC